LVAYFTVALRLIFLPQIWNIPSKSMLCLKYSISNLKQKNRRDSDYLISSLIVCKNGKKDIKELLMQQNILASSFSDLSIFPFAFIAVPDVEKHIIGKKV
jgi:hypothetical protein